MDRVKEIVANGDHVAAQALLDHGGLSGEEQQLLTRVVTRAAAIEAEAKPVEKSGGQVTTGHTNPVVPSYSTRTVGKGSKK